MKTMKKLLALTLALALVLSLAITASAEDTGYTITIKNSATGHTYEAYQIFAGTLSSNGKTLSDITWGESVDGTALLAALKDDTTLGTTFADCETAEDVAALLTEKNAPDFAAIAEKKLSNVKSTSTWNENNKNYTISNLNPGYYLIKDQDNSQDDKHDAYTEFILEVVSSIEVEPKTGDVTVTKKVKDVDDSTGVTSTWQDSADFDVNDTIEYKITGTLPDNYAKYETYYYKFFDTLSKGLTVDTDDVKVWLVTKGQETGTEITSYFDITLSDVAAGTTGTYADGKVLLIECEDLTEINGIDSSKEILVTYTATLNGNAVIGSAGNPNKAGLEYSNNPNQADGGDHGKVPEDIVIVFTYKTVIDKVKANPDYDPEDPGSEKFVPLTGAEFELWKFEASEDGEETLNDKDGTWVKKTLTTSDDGTKFTLERLDAGEYKIVEKKAPDGYNSIEDIYFTVVAEHMESADQPTFTSLVVKDKNGDVISTEESNDNGAFSFVVNKTEGSMTIDVENKSGTELPSTGGIGTTIFYVVGGLLTLAAVVLLVTKKKMSAAE